MSATVIGTCILIVFFGTIAGLIWLVLIGVSEEDQWESTVDGEDLDG